MFFSNAPELALALPSMLTDQFLGTRRSFDVQAAGEPSVGMNWGKIHGGVNRDYADGPIA